MKTWSGSVGDRWAGSFFKRFSPSVSRVKFRMSFVVGVRPARRKSFPASNIATMQQYRIASGIDRRYIDKEHAWKFSAQHFFDLCIQKPRDKLPGMAHSCARFHHMAAMMATSF